MRQSSSPGGSELAHPEPHSVPILRILLLLLSLSYAAGAASLPRILTIEIKVLPPEGEAFCRYNPDGTVKGGHMFGGRGHEATGTVPGAQVKAIWNLAQELQGRGVFTGPVVWDQHSRPKNHIVIGLEDGQQLRFSWAFRTNPGETRTAKLAQLLMDHRVGGW